MTDSIFKPGATLLHPDNCWQCKLLEDDMTTEDGDYSWGIRPGAMPWDANFGDLGDEIIATAPDDPKPDFGKAVTKVYRDAEDLLLKKHKDYGPKNISGAPGGPLNGLRVRIYDKIARINNLLDSGAEPENESLRDSFLDCLNYCAIALLVLDGQWPHG